ncbi:polyprenol dehydrogenase-like [Dermatophagoides pteronyssinus]|uniref:polyprenol dehydrogenase-like n=1 Tax=Dermatophagoides pteronyssinus TaxID=6956 RepID=UPI003F67D06E
MNIFAPILSALAILSHHSDNNVRGFEVVINPVFITANRLQFYAVVLPYLLREHQRKVAPYQNNIRILNENDPDIRGNLEGKVAIITGGSRGLGVEIVRSFLRKGARVITTASSNDPGKIESRFQSITKGIPEGKWNLEIWHLDLMSMNSVIRFLDRFKNQNDTRLNYFIGNAGVMFPPFKLSEDGFESQFSINYLGHVLMSYHLLPYLYRTAKQQRDQSRLVLVTSCLHHIPTRIRYNDLQALQVYSPHYQYGLSKLSILMFIYSLNRTLSIKQQDWNERVKVFAVHPGLVDTDLLNTIDIMKQYPLLANQLTFRDTKAGAETIIYASLSSQLNRKNGEYFEDSKPVRSSSLSYNLDQQNRLWMVTRNLLEKWTNGYWFEDL